MQALPSRRACSFWERPAWIPLLPSNRKEYFFYPSQNSLTHTFAHYATKDLSCCESLNQ